jgi:thiol:disulfide interchange protein DsbC
MQSLLFNPWHTRGPALCPGQKKGIIGFYAKGIAILNVRKKTMRLKILALAVLGILGTTACFGESACSHVTIDWISGHVPLPGDARVVLAREKGVLCEVILSIDNGLVPVYAGKDFILAGQLFEDGRSVTRETLAAMPDMVERERERAALKNDLERENRKSFFQKNIKALDEFVSLSFKPDQVRNFCYVITDPNCSHCKELLPKLRQAALESGTEVKVIIYPVLGPQSRDMASLAICNHTSYQDYVQIKMPESVLSCERAERLIQRTEVFLRSSNLSSVPLVVAGDGSWVVENNDITRIRAHLGIEPGMEADGPGGACITDEAQ